jgi:hypothetical protein
MNENLRLYRQIAKLKLQIEPGRLKQDLNRDSEEVELIHCGGREGCALCRGKAVPCLRARGTTDLFLDRFSLLTQASRRQNGGSCELSRGFDLLTACPRLGVEAQKGRGVIDGRN